MFLYSKNPKVKCCYSSTPVEDIEPAVPDRLLNPARYDEIKKVACIKTLIKFLSQ